MNIRFGEYFFTMNPSAPQQPVMEIPFQRNYHDILEGVNMFPLESVDKERILTVPELSILAHCQSPCKLRLLL